MPLRRFGKAAPAFSLLSALFLCGTAVNAQEGDVVVSVKPIHSLVAGVMKGVGEPELLVRGGESPHTYSLRPSDARMLDDARIVFWIGDVFETFLARPLDSLAGDARVVTLSEVPGMRLLPVREGGAWEGHAHPEGGHDHSDAPHDHAHDADHEHADEVGEHADEHASVDGHLWLDPANARLIVKTAADALGEVDPANAAAYRGNAAAMIGEIDALERELDQRLGMVRNRPYVVFHDAYQYFEEAFGLNAVGSITVSPDVQSGARRLAEIRERIVGSGASCVFSEPLLEARLIDTVTEGLDVGRGELDPEGTALQPGEDLYPALMRALADELVACLSRS